MFRRSRRQVACLVAMLHLLSACYGFVPVSTAPRSGTHVAVVMSDEGRIALRDQLGPGVFRIEGRLVESNGNEFVLRATSVTAIGGRPLPLDTLRLALQRRFVDSIEERRLSRKRTWTTVGSAVVVAAVFLVLGGFIGNSTPPEDTPGGPPVDQYRGVK